MTSDPATSLEGIWRPDPLFTSYLKPALRQPGCPLCRILRDEDLHYLRVFLREGKNDGRVLLRLLASWGLCPQHASALVHFEPVEHGDGLGMGTLYDWLLDQARRRLEDLRRFVKTGDGALLSQWSRRPFARSARAGKVTRQRKERAVCRLARAGPCPACEARQWHAEYVVEGFVRALEPASGLPVIHEMYLASGGLCFPHSQATLMLRPSSGVRELIVQKQHELVGSLKAALEAALDRGVTGDVSDRGPMPESAWVRASRVVAGATTWQPPER